MQLRKTDGCIACEGPIFLSPQPGPLVPRVHSLLCGFFTRSFWLVFLAESLTGVFTARKRSLGQGNIFTPVCHSVHRGACVVAPGGACMVAPGGHAWLLRGGVHGCSQGGMHGCSGGACMVAPRGHAWLLPGGGVCVVAWEGVHGFIRGGMHSSIRGVCVVLFRGACVVLFGGHAWFYLGGVHGFFSFFGYNEIRSMSGQYTSYWNASLFEILLYNGFAKLGKDD